MAEASGMKLRKIENDCSTREPSSLGGRLKRGALFVAAATAKPAQAATHTTL